MPDSLDPIVNLAKRRGFFFQSAELYGGASGLLDLGPLGVELLNNIKRLWWQRMIRERDDVVGIDSSILTPHAVLKASGHVDSFSDPLIECSNCHIRLRSDHYLEDIAGDQAESWTVRWRDQAIKDRKIGLKKADVEAREAYALIQKSGDRKDLQCPNCLKVDVFSEPRTFNMMFKVNLGAVDNENSVAYLRPETAQGIFTNFKTVLETSRQKLPFGIGQIGKAFRNEITIGNSLFRVREFEQAEIEYFVEPGKDEAAHDMWIDACERFLLDDIGIKAENLRRFEHAPEKLSHYSKRTVDLEYRYPFGGFGELWGIANRTDFDLGAHQVASGQDLRVFNEQTKEKVLPYVIEPSVGLGRLMLALLLDAYEEFPTGRDGLGTELETVLHLPAELAPYRVAVLPLMKKDGLAECARTLHEQLRKSVASTYDESGAIGRRYRRQDEIGTPWCVTIDYQTLEDGTVTLRNRDTMEQRRLTHEGVLHCL